MARNLFARDHLDLFNARMDRLLEPNDTLALGFFGHSIFTDANDGVVVHEVLKYARDKLRMNSTAHFDIGVWQPHSPDWSGIYRVFDTTGDAKDSIKKAAMFAYRKAQEVENAALGASAVHSGSAGGMPAAGRGGLPATGAPAAAGPRSSTGNDIRSSLTSLKCLDGVVWYSGEKSGFQARLDVCQHFLRILSADRLRRCIGKDFN